MASSFTAFFDASVLYGSALRNLLMHLALIGLFRAKWSGGVHEEWMTALLRNRPDLSREKLERTRMLMDLHAEDALVTGYEDLIEGLKLPDPDDRHVLAAAIRGRADIIVTANTRDFPAEVLRSFGIEPQHPDEFVVHLLDLAPGLVLTAARRHRESLKNPPKTPEEYLDMLEKEGLTETVAILREYMTGE
jgi:predicted nucleic acid-binding protein